MSKKAFDFGGSLMGDAVNRKGRMLGTYAVLLASFIWGTEFVVEKDVLFTVEPNYANLIRFFLGAVIGTIVFHRKVRNITKEDIKVGIITGTFMGLGNAFQAMGLETINAGVNAFLCVLYIPIIPFAVWFLDKKAPRPTVFICGAIALTGVFFISYNPEAFAVRFSIGEIYSLISALFYAAAMISIERLAAKTDSMTLTIMQLFVYSIISIIFALILETPPPVEVFHSKLIMEFIYLAIFASLLAQLLMNYGMKLISAIRASLIFPTESIFALILGIIFLKEHVSGTMLMGSLLIVCAILLTEIDFKAIFQKKENIE